MSKRATLVIAVAVVVVAAGTAVVWPRGDKRAAPTPTVRTAQATKGEVRIVLNETGEVEPVRTIVVKPPISGTVRRLLVDDGDSVKEGQLLAVVDPDLSQARAVAELRAASGRAQVQLDQMEREVRKGQSLLDENLLSTSEMDDRQSEFRRAQLEVQNSQEQLRALEAAGVDPQQPAQSLKVVSPAAGVVIAVGAEEGESVLAGTGTLGGGTELIKVADLSRLRVKAAVNEVDVDKVALQLPVKITVDAYPKAEFHGSVTHVAPAARAEAGTGVRVFDVEIEVSQPDPRLRPGMTANLDIEGPHRENVLTVPIEAVFRKDGKDVVYRMASGQPVAVPVDVGLVDLARAEILGGLAEGDVVAIEDPAMIKPAKEASGR